MIIEEKNVIEAAIKFVKSPLPENEADLIARVHELLDGEPQWENS